MHTMTKTLIISTSDVRNSEHLAFWGHWLESESNTPFTGAQQFPQLPRGLKRTWS